MEFFFTVHVIRRICFCFCSSDFSSLIVEWGRLRNSTRLCISSCKLRVSECLGQRSSSAIFMNILILYDEIFVASCWVCLLVIRMSGFCQHIYSFCPLMFFLWRHLHGDIWGFQSCVAEDSDQSVQAAWSLRMKALRPFETLVNIYQSTRHNILEEMNIHHL